MRLQPSGSHADVHVDGSGGIETILVQVCAPCAPTQFWEMSSQDFGLPPVHVCGVLPPQTGVMPATQVSRVATQLVAEPQLPACAPEHAPATKPPQLPLAVLQVPAPPLQLPLAVLQVPAVTPAHTPLPVLHVPSVLLQLPLVVLHAPATTPAQFPLPVLHVPPVNPAHTPLPLLQAPAV